MKEEGVDVRLLMEDVAAVVREPSTVVETLSAAGRPRVFSLEYVYPHGEARGIYADILARRKGIQSYFEAGSDRKYAGWLVTRMKRLVLVAANWYIKPLTEDIDDYNAVVAGALQDISRSLEEIRARLDELERGPGGAEERSG